MSNILFGVAVVILLGAIAGAIWSVAAPDRRLWPPPSRGSWPYLLNWLGFYVVCGISLLLMLMYWNSWIFPSPLRLFVGVPLAVLGGVLALWGMIAAGWKNTSGLRDGFVSSGPYRFSRNPQYLGDIVLFIGMSVIANSLLVWITHLLLALVFVLAPFAEEPWLEQQYGDAYREYRKRVRRFL